MAGFIIKRCALHFRPYEGRSGGEGGFGPFYVRDRCCDLSLVAVSDRKRDLDGTIYCVKGRGTRLGQTGSALVTELNIGIGFCIGLLQAQSGLGLLDCLARKLHFRSPEKYLIHRDRHDRIGLLQGIRERDRRELGLAHFPEQGDSGALCVLACGSGGGQKAVTLNFYPEQIELGCRALAHPVAMKLDDAFKTGGFLQE